MLNTPTLEKNPKLYSLVPMFYMVWADAVLTPEEHRQVLSLIEKQSWISPEEKTFLLSYLNPAKPPSAQTLKSWQNEIRNISENMSADVRENLIDISLRLAKSKGMSQDNEQATRQYLKEIEHVLGIVSSESAFHLRSARHETLTQQQSTAPGFDPDSMGDLLDGPHKLLIQQIKTILSDPEFNYVDPDNLSQYREQVLKWCHILAKQGYGAIAFPEEYGGKNDMAAYFTVMETLSYHDLSTVIKFGVQFGLFGMSILFLGTKKHHDQYLKSTGTLDLPGCFAMTETGHGSNVKGVETTATYQHKNRTIIIHTPHRSAGKEYIGNAALHGRMATVFAKLIIDQVDYGVNAFLVPLRDDKGKTLPGISIEDCGRKMGLNGVDNGRIYFNKVEIPYAQMLDKYAGIDEEGAFTSPITSDSRRFFTMLSTLVGGRIGIPRSGLSATKSGLTIAIRYGDGRKQFGPMNGDEVPILNYRTHQRRLMPLLAKTYALHFSLQYLTNRFLKRSEEDIQEIEAMAAGLKAFTTWHTTAALQECREACGGKGYLSENRLDRLKNDTDVYTTFEGDNTVLMQLVAKSRLSDFKKEFSDINFFGMLNYVANQAKTSITEMNPIATRNTDIEHLLDFDFHLAAFRYREREILTNAARRFKKHLDAGMDSFDAFNQTQYHMVAVGIAYVERVVLEQFIDQVNLTLDEKCKQSLKKLCQLYALHQIELNKGWYLEQDYMEGSKTKAIRKLVNQLCWEIRQDAVPLVDAFRIPDSCLAAPIATRHKQPG